MNIHELLTKLLENAMRKIDSTFNIKGCNFMISEPRIPQEQNPEKIEFDLSANLAIIIAKKYNISPSELANKLLHHLQTRPEIIKISVTTPGFINIKFKNNIYLDFITFLSSQNNYGSRQVMPVKINNEFVSVNPTGYLHAGHARNAVVGSVLSNILRYAGYMVTNEYYINDAGNQINILADSAFVRYQNLFKIEAELPEDSYRGQDIIDFAKYLKRTYKDYFLTDFENKKEEFKKLAVDWFMQEAKKDLKKMRITFEVFSSEKSLFERKLVLKSLKTLEKYIYTQDGATFLKTSDFGDDKDRVLVKSDGSYTYFLSDIAYHLDKAKRAKKLINVWGADHSGYIARIKNSLTMNEFDTDNFHVVLIQLVRLIKDGSEFKMSKRSGTSLTIRELLENVSVDALRYNLAARDANTKMDLDLDLATKLDENNPVFILKNTYKKVNEFISNNKSLKIDIEDQYTKPEIDLIIELSNFKNIIKTIAKTYKIQLLPQYLIKICNLANTLLNNQEKQINLNKMYIYKSFKTILETGLKLLDISTR
ncbi:Arginyl-tRNA synthetase [Mycoplasmopsis californica]|uniref:Arginine--tRNA ligase n=1 Tax=Mycoplasmopsis equigenitalium TaxID=114883 RepID=A0ABY5J3L7_9BACT|nr:arginine--tRNA ligase [Mycoplasmopsis equigenitalium]UUD36742.1 arginine--tRNA ligase [Mycoplasmopsis equigenitalium]VEU69964.1 Arginyl-tRNA synthetase [Mycoplasmopsis californica]